MHYSNFCINLLRKIIVITSWSAEYVEVCHRKLYFFAIVCRTDAYNRLIALYTRQPALELGERLTTHVVLKFPTSRLTFASRPSSLPLRCYTKENTGDTVAWRTWGQEPTLSLFSPNFGLMWPLVIRRSPFTHTSHCITTSRPAAATQMRVTISRTIAPHGFLCWMPFLPQPSLFPSLEASSEYAGLHTVRLGHSMDN